MEYLLQIKETVFGMRNTNKANKKSSFVKYNRVTCDRTRAHLRVKKEQQSD